MQPAMTRGSFVLVALAALVTNLGAPGCGDSTSSADAPSVKGSWVMASQTVSGSPTPAASVDGALVLGATDFAFAGAQPLGGLLTTYTTSADGKSFSLAGGTSVPFTVSAQPQLTLQLPGSRTAVFSSDTAQAAHSVSVKGTVTAPSPTPAYMHPKLLLAFLQRDAPGFVNMDTRSYLDLTFSGGTATFDLELTRDALGTERIVFGPPNVAIAIAFVVVFDDRNGNGILDSLFDACDTTSTTTDCVLGVSPIVLGSSDGTSPQLSASPYAYLRAGWSNAVMVTDARGGGTKTGLVSLDGSKTLAFDVALWADPHANAVPQLDLTVPTVP